MAYVPGFMKGWFGQSYRQPIVPVSPGSPYLIVRENVSVKLEARETYDYALVEGDLGNAVRFDYVEWIAQRLRQTPHVVLDLSRGKENDTSTAAAALSLRNRLAGKKPSKLVIIGNQTLDSIFQICDLHSLREHRVYLVRSLEDAEIKLELRKPILPPEELARDVDSVSA